MTDPTRCVHCAQPSAGAPGTMGPAWIGGSYLAAGLRDPDGPFCTACAESILLVAAMRDLPASLMRPADLKARDHARESGGVWHEDRAVERARVVGCLLLMARQRDEADREARETTAAQRRDIRDAAERRHRMCWPVRGVDY